MTGVREGVREIEAGSSRGLSWESNAERARDDVSCALPPLFTVFFCFRRPVCITGRDEPEWEHVKEQGSLDVHSPRSTAASRNASGNERSKQQQLARRAKPGGFHPFRQAVPPRGCGAAGAGAGRRRWLRRANTRARQATLCYSSHQVRLGNGAEKEEMVLPPSGLLPLPLPLPTLRLSSVTAFSANLKFKSRLA